jgi:hypothetical protein
MDGSERDVPRTGDRRRAGSIERSEMDGSERDVPRTGDRRRAGSNAEMERRREKL